MWRRVKPNQKHCDNRCNQNCGVSQATSVSHSVPPSTAFPRLKSSVETQDVTVFSPQRFNMGRFLFRVNFLRMTSVKFPAIFSVDAFGNANNP
jgi:hypothetical protein